MRNRRSLLLRVVVPSTAVVTGLFAVTSLIPGDDSRSAVLAAASSPDTPEAGADTSLLNLTDAYTEAKTFQATAQKIATDQRMAEIAAQRAAAAAAEKARLAAEAEAARKAAAEKAAIQKAERAQRLAAERAARLAAKPPVLAAAAAPTDGYKNDVWTRLRNCESGGRYDRNSGNGFYGAYQFHPRTWRGLGYPGLPHQASPEMQDEAARRLQARSGWGQWPACSRRIGVR
jgi:resuscitation-promoting factor RpfB